MRLYFLLFFFPHVNIKYVQYMVRKSVKENWPKKWHCPDIHSIEKNNKEETRDITMSVIFLLFTSSVNASGDQSGLLKKCKGHVPSVPPANYVRGWKEEVRTVMSSHGTKLPSPALFCFLFLLLFVFQPEQMIINVIKFTGFCKFL